MSGYVSTLVGNIVIQIVNPLIWLLIGAAFVYFMWGAALFVKDADSEEGRSKGKQHMGLGLLGLLIMFSAFGIMCLVGETIGAPADVMHMIPFC